MHHIRGRFEESNVRVLELNVSANFALMKQVVLNVKWTQITMFCSISIFKKRSWYANFFLRILKGQQVICTVVFQQIHKFKIYPLKKFRKVAGSVDKKSKLSHILIEGFRFWAYCKQVETFSSRLDPPKIWRHIFVEIRIFIFLMRINCIPLHYTENPPKQWISHKSLNKEFFKSNQR